MRSYSQRVNPWGDARTCTRFHNTPCIDGQESKHNKTDIGRAPTPDRDGNYDLIDIGAIAWPVVDDSGKEGEGASRCNLGHRERATLGR